MLPKPLPFRAMTRWLCCTLTCLCLFPPPSLQAQLGVAGRNASEIRLNQLRTQVITPHGQQPPYEWSSVYLRNITSNIPPETVYALDSSVCGAGVVNTNQFGEEITVFYSYNNDGQISHIVFRQETMPGVYENYSRKSYTYLNGKRTSYLYQLWNGIAGSWEDDYEEQTTYNMDGKQENFRIRETDMAGQWQNLFREQRLFDSTGNVTEVRSAKWGNNAWQDTARKEIKYNTRGYYTAIYEESWNGSGWDTLSRETASYGSLGMIWENYLLERKASNGFEGVVREGYQYDDYGYWVGMTRQAWDGTGASWENLLRETYQYNRTGLWLGWGQEIHQDTGWVNDTRQYFNKVSNLREDRMQSWDTTAGMWNNEFRVITQYDSHKNLVQEAGVQSWDTNASEWLNTAISRRCQHYWSPVTGTQIAPQLPELSCSLTNPYRVYEPISCESLHPGKRYDLRLMDIQGRTVYQKTVPGGESFSIDRSLPTGIYHLSIYENQQMRFLRKLVINP